MALKTVAILSPGDMGSGVGRALRAHGYDVVTCLAGRGQGSRARATRAGFREVASLEALVSAADIVLSILPPESAPQVAREVARAMRATGRKPPYADCNAVAPETARGIGATIAAAGAEFIDGGIIGTPPGKSDLPTRMYVSGPRAEIMAEFDGKGIYVRQSGPEIGRASAIKMCYAAVSKGTNALHTAALVTAEALGVGQAVRDEWKLSAPGVYDRMQKSVPWLAADAARWVGEMVEIAKTFDSCGVTPKFHQGAADIFRLLDASPFSAETRETLDRSRTLEQTVKTLVEYLPAGKAAE
jgi:3-hydroxyisobutyrate dehydrogenase-like beta-hydroxyacid dehydrogenase